MALTLFGISTAFVQRVEGIAPVAGALARVLAPVDAVLRGATGLVGGAVVRWQDAGELAETVERLEQHVAELEVNNAKLGDVTRENEALRALAGFRRERIDLDLIGASIQGMAIAREPGGLLHALWLDVGIADGVAEGDPVTTNRGLVGRVVRAHGQSSQVRLISDPLARVGVRIERTQSTGILVGSPSGELTVRYLPRDPDGAPSVAVGDLVFTSGLADATHYPQMLPIGQVIEVRQSDERTSLEAVVWPHVDFNALAQVLVVTDWDPIALPVEALPADAQPPSAPDAAPGAGTGG